VVSKYQQGCDGQLGGTVIRIDAEEVRRHRWTIFDQTGEPSHLAYQRKFTDDVRKYGRQNPEIRRNYYLEDTVEEGNFLSRERLLSCARSPGVNPPCDELFLGGDWARKPDNTWFSITNRFNDVIDWLKVPHVSYEEQVQIAKEWFYAERIEKRTKPDGTIEEVKYRYIDRIIAVRNDSTGGTGDAPNEMLSTATGLPMGEESLFVFSKSSKNDLHLCFEAAIFKEEGDPMRFSYPADHPLAAEFEDQMTKLEREYLSDGEYLSVHHPKTADGRDDAPDCTALALFAASTGIIGDIVMA